MPERKEILEFPLGNTEPKTPNQKFLSDIYKSVQNRLINELRKGSADIHKIHSRVLISMIVTHILINLLIRSIDEDNDITTRFSMVEEVIEEVGELTRELWKMVETEKADLKIAH